MPQQILTLKFDNPINTSVQAGDTIYYTPTQLRGGFSTSNLGGVIAFGVIIAVYPLTYDITVMYEGNVTPPLANDYIMFGKNKAVNSSSLIGNYAEVTFLNNSKQEAELFSIGSEVSESSK